MKILRLQFKNLNSLTGEWSIDFTRPEYVSDGIFAITGPTGSGKSTILDAICLALYGQTPRLGKITKSGNELMSRHTGECFAEVIFSTSAGTFCCRWSQHRSRRRPEGDLQAQKHEISDLSTGLVIQAKVQETLWAIEERTGMDFDRFTRSMLLAQGGFAAFLQAEPDRRAPVLEQITGTEIYSTISMKVHERQRAERSKLELLQAESDSVRLLGAEELKRLELDHIQRLENEKELSLQADKASAELRWLQEISRLEEELAGIDLEASAILAEKEAFRPDANRIVFAGNAAAIEHRYVHVSIQRDELQRYLNDLFARESLLPGLQATLSEAEARFEAVEGDLRSALEAAAALRPIITQVRQLDSRISEKIVDRDLRKLEFEELDKRLLQLESDRLSTAALLETVSTSLHDLRTWQEEHRVDADLVTGLSGIQHALDELRPAARREALAVAAVFEANRALHERQREKEALEPEVAVSKSKLEEARKALDALRESYESQLAGRSLKSLRMAAEGVKERISLLEEIAALYASGKELLPKITRIDESIRVVLDKRAGTEAQLVHVRQLLAMAEREAAAQEQLGRLAARVRDLEEERLRLTDGTPCPLCGSITHPYCEPTGSLPESDDQQLLLAKQSLHEHAGALKNLEIVIAECGKEIEQMMQRRSDLVDMREQSGRRCLELLKAAGIPDHAREAEPAVLLELKEAEARLGEFLVRIESLETTEERMSVDAAALLQLQDSVTADERRLEQVVERCRTLHGELQRLEQEREATRRELEARRRSLLAKLEPYGAVDGELVDPDAYAGALAARAARWQLEADRGSTLESSLLSGRAALKNLDSQLELIGRDRTLKHTVLSTLSEGIDADRGERLSLFGARDPDAEEDRLETVVHELRAGVEEAGEARAWARQELHVVDTAAGELRKAIDERRKLLDQLLAAFAGELQQKGFSDETAFLEARLPEPERERIENISAELVRRSLDIDSRRNDRMSRLGEKRQRRLTEMSLEDLAVRIAQLQEGLRNVRAEMGAIARQIEENEHAVGEQRQKALAVEAQKSECRRWDILHDLIGSADGKKFRNFAQGLTFEIMIAHANRQLVGMTERYLLVRDQVDPLELSVIDQWQAGEVRSTRNLSGGESFIVSLALALGLSQMSSRNVRVDSLFLDEGFGTLDEEALETALETLSGLQQTGKLIGIISHVPALKERIATQIHVSPLTGGRSSISGPGVAGLS
ncbi:MAG: AAA family ATPase [Chlorobiaceae bacterium]|nr:AAA family ATPase [Chlorobiaceae bacterium]